MNEAVAKAVYTWRVVHRSQLPDEVKDILVDSYSIYTRLAKQESNADELLSA